MRTTTTTTSQTMKTLCFYPCSSCFCQTLVPGFDPPSDPSETGRPIVGSFSHTPTAERRPCLPIGFRSWTRDTLFMTSNNIAKPKRLPVVKFPERLCMFNRAHSGCETCLLIEVHGITSGRNLTQSDINRTHIRHAVSPHQMIAMNFA